MLELFKLTSVAILSALFSTFIALLLHRKKLWWGIRVESYTKLIESLSDVPHYFSSHFDAHTSQRDLGKDYFNKLNEAWEQGFPRVRRAADTGAFIYSPSVNEALSEFLTANGEVHEDYFLYLESNMIAAKKCLTRVVDCSKRDLVTCWWWI